MISKTGYHGPNAVLQRSVCRCGQWSAAVKGALQPKQRKEKGKEFFLGGEIPKELFVAN